MMRIIVFLCLLLSIETSIYLYNTEDRSSIEFFDCFTLDSMFFCRRPRYPIDLMRSTELSSCYEENGGITHRFSDLRSNNISITRILHEWKSSLEQVEAYIRYLRNQNPSDGYVCQCQDEQAFGKYCEYKLPFGIDVEETVDWQVNMRWKHHWEVQRMGDITCYEGIECDSGALCLDWREICDGRQNCLYGKDEANCDILDLNICDDDEYRCSNGMCIPDVYFIDGERDCLDWTDEIGNEASNICSDHRIRVKCDDHLCLPNRWSCGDGQCIQHRFIFQTPQYAEACASRRDQFFICETHYKRLVWTMPNGRCYGGGRFTDDPPIISNQIEQCEYLLKCALSLGSERHCPCNYGSIECLKRFGDICSNMRIYYPRKALMNPAVFFYFYTKDGQWQNFWPSHVLINGTLKCRQALSTLSTVLKYSPFTRIHQAIDQLFCNPTNHSDQFNANKSLTQCFQANESIDICQTWNPCLSITHIRDGWFDCSNDQDEMNQTKETIERNCQRIQRHRFRCSIDQTTCLMVTAFGDHWNDCKNGYDEFWYGTNRTFASMKCDETVKDDCLMIRQYIEDSWLSKISNNSQGQGPISFRAYCDTFWNLKTSEDENKTLCEQVWKCTEQQIQCRTGQCIDEDWQNDYEWDCFDAADEKDLFDTFPFVCLPTRRDQNQIVVYLNQSQLGNDQIDCLGAVDERNRLKHCSEPMSMLGYNFICASTNHCIPFYQLCRENNRCPNLIDDEPWCSLLRTLDRCYTSTDFVCFNGTCIEDSRCNQNIDCPFGEDEFYCDYSSFQLKMMVDYRSRKESNVKVMTHAVQLPLLPNRVNITELVEDRADVLPKNVRNTPTGLAVSTPFWCNRGIGILFSNHSIVCFCPPQYYGPFCQYHADRLLVLLHLNLSQSIYNSQTDPTIVIKLLVLFLFNDQVLITHEFHVRPALAMSTFAKKWIHFPYSRSSTLRQHRQHRYNNRTDIIVSQPYTIRIEAYEIHINEKFVLIAIWQYPIQFDYLPVFRFAKVLHLNQIDRWQRNPCLSHPCPSNTECHSLMNNRSQFVCRIRDSSCSKEYCAPSAVCQCNYRSLLRGNITPHCLCPYNRYGDRCEIVHDYCQFTQCLNGGSCYPGSQPDRTMCLCTKEYSGSHCQTKKSQFRLLLIDERNYRAAVIQYLRIQLVSLNLMVVHQQVYTKLPRSIEYIPDEKTLPEIVLAKLYDSHPNLFAADLYVLSVTVNATEVEGSTELSDNTRCTHMRQISSPITYHRLCIENETLTCFHDDVYLCICGNNHSHVECFLYDYEFDQCSHCLSSGRCLRGDPKQSNDFLCLCPSCYSGRRCQFNSKSFAFTLDQLFYTDLNSSTKIRTSILLLIFSFLCFILAIPNNFFSFLTFRRKSCLRNGVGHYLLVLSVVNQIDLTFFLIRLIHLISNMIDMSSPSLIDEILCRSLSFLFTCSSRLVYWLSSLIAIERLYMTVILNGQCLKKARTARCLIVFVTSSIFIVHSYEIIFYKSFFDLDENRGTICVFEYPHHSRSTWNFLHPFVTIMNSIVPFFINLLSTIVISFIVVRNKIKTTNSFRNRFRLIIDVLRENKELVVGPAITLIPQLFSLPFLIVGFVVDCQNLENSWLRYLLIVSFWTRLTPQITSFFLYITPSSFYLNEWRKTHVAQRIYRRFKWNLPFNTISMTVLSRKNVFLLKN